MSHLPAPADHQTAGVPVATSLLLVVPAKGDAGDLGGARLPHPSSPQGWTAWAVALHDELAARDTPPTAADVARIASWLAVQAVGAASIAVVEPRCDRFAGLWAGAAARADMSAAIAAVEDGRWIRRPLAAAPAPAEQPMLPGRRAAARLWLADRAEGIARRAVRYVQR